MTIEEAKVKLKQEIEEENAVDDLAEKLVNSVVGRISSGQITDFRSKIYGKEDVIGGGIDKDKKILKFWDALIKNDVIELKALSEGIAGSGGYLVPDELSSEIIKELAAPTRMRSLVRVIQMSRDTLKIPKIGSRPKVRWTSENATKSTTTADFEEKELVVYKMAAILYSSDELVEDAGPEINVVKLIIDMFAEALAEEEDRVITVGSGTGQPTGLTSCSISSITCSGNLDFDDLINLIYALPAQYRTNAKFLVNNVNIREMRKLKDSNNRYLWQDAVAPGQPATFFGYPVIPNNHLSEAVIYFGNYKLAYWLGDRRRMTVTVSGIAGTAWERDQTAIRVVQRIAGNCVLENAVRVLNQIP